MSGLVAFLESIFSIELIDYGTVIITLGQFIAGTIIVSISTLFIRKMKV